MSFIQEHQLSIMLYMSGMCGILAFMTLITESLSRRRKSILSLMEFSGMVLLLLDRLCYLYRGDVTELGFILVRVCNGMVYFLSLFIPHLVTQYLKDLSRLKTTPFLLKVCDVLFVLGTVLVVVSQFTDLYYSIDAQNNYHRASGYVLSYTIPFLIILLQEYTIVQNRSQLGPSLVLPLLLSISLPTIASIVQIFNYGVSLTNIAMVCVVIGFHIYSLLELNRAVKRARNIEIESYKEAERIKTTMFEQTAEALANAIDAKDKYTHGHSTRVANLSCQIAKEAGFTDRECNEIYYAALLHDIGKIGIRDDIINKDGKLTDEEFAQIKQHPIQGYQILSSIKQAPSLSVGAHYHHERYDGTGYPDGLRGDAIPEIARIIAVADAYDAMTSTRSYRGRLSKQKTKQEIIDGMGKQFDPRFAEIMLGMIPEDDSR